MQVKRRVVTCFPTIFGFLFYSLTCKKFSTIKSPPKFTLPRNNSIFSVKKEIKMIFILPYYHFWCLCLCGFILRPSMRLVKLKYRSQQQLFSVNSRKYIACENIRICLIHRKKKFIFFSFVLHNDHFHCLLRVVTLNSFHFSEIQWNVNRISSLWEFFTKSNIMTHVS